MAKATSWIGVLVLAFAAAVGAAGEVVQRWGRFELSLRSGRKHGNPFTEVKLTCRFEQGGRAVEVEGFYDGDGVWRVRFMPTEEGEWTYRTRSSDAELDGKSGTVTVGPPSKTNHGPVVVRNKHYLAYADGTAYFQVGTTCYAWAHQGDALEARTLKTLAAAPFNKIRMCVFPKSYAYNKNAPTFYPFAGKPPKGWDFTRFDPRFFRHFERRVDDLMKLGIEADLILFHPYDRWGFSRMKAADDDRYLRYLVARLAAWRNVWWSLANEYDLMRAKKPADWDRFFRLIRGADPYGHLRGIHNCRAFYDHTRSWVTHASVQSSNFRDAVAWRDKYAKPIVYDECKYEGNIPQGWGNISAEEMTHRFWMGTCSGCYVGHGETYKHPDDVLWWSKGGVLHGQSPPRIAFLKRILAGEPFEQMAPDRKLCPGNYALSLPGRRYLVYCMSPAGFGMPLPAGKAFKADGIDTWGMTSRPLGTARGPTYRFTPPKAPYLLRLAAYEPGEPLRPEAKAAAEPREGVAPLKVTFTAGGGGRYRWDFGDGATGEGARAQHTYKEPGIYTARLTVTDARGAEAGANVTVAVDSPGGASAPIVRVGVAGADKPRVKLHGKIARGKDGAFDFGDGPPWKWVSVGDGPVEALEGLRSFTVVGWAKASSLAAGPGGNRIAFNLNYDRGGFDLVCLPDGRLRLSVNEWPDRVRNDSSPGKIRMGEWVFFAVTYDATRSKDNVHWHFGGANAPASLDRATTYTRGPTGPGSGPLTIGNYNTTIHRHGTDRQFRGRLRDIRIYGSRVSSRGALGAAAIRAIQKGG